MTLTKHRQIGWVFFGKVKEDWRFDINTGIKKNSQNNKKVGQDQWILILLLGLIKA